MIVVKISTDALKDINDGFRFYEAQQPGLGRYFADCLRNDIESLRLSGGIHRIVSGQYRRLLSAVFPYGIFYTLEQGCVTIWAVVDLRRDPEWIRNELDDRS